MGSETDSRSYRRLQMAMIPRLSTKPACACVDHTSPHSRPPPCLCIFVAVMDGLASPWSIVARYILRTHRKNCKDVDKSAHISKRPSLGRFVASSLNGSCLAGASPSSSLRGVDWCDENLFLDACQSVKSGGILTHCLCWQYLCNLRIVLVYIIMAANLWHLVAKKL